MPTGSRSTEIGNLADLTLDRNRLYLFVAGPGRGEGLALALPGGGWIFLDGCRVKSGFYPVWEIYQRFRQTDEPRPGLILSHPHADHVAGIPELLERTNPEWVACTGTDRDVIVAEVRKLTEWRPRLPAQHQQRSAVIVALRAILNWSEQNGRLIATRSGIEIPLLRSDLRLHCVAPDRVFLSSFLASQDGAHPSQHANQISNVLELSFGSTRLVLAGDLPDLDDNDQPLTEGMSTVLRRYPSLAEHHSLKLPHHGSWRATCDALMGPTTRGRYWVLTPFNTSGLPDLEHPRGLEYLLSLQPEVHLTALSAPQARQFSRPSPPLTLEQLRSATLSAKMSDDPILVGAEDVSLIECEGLDPVWCCAFDDCGQVRGRWRGVAAVLAVRQ